MTNVREVNGEIEYPVIPKNDKEKDVLKKTDFDEEMTNLNELFPELDDLNMNNDGIFKYSDVQNHSNDQEQVPEDLDDVINEALLSVDEYKDKSSEKSMGGFSPFDTPISASSVTDEEIESGKKEKPASPIINLTTLTSIKKSMVDTSKLISLFTTLKTTYLKLCKEFNYLLSKFNENEKVKIQLIQENLKLKNLLSELIINREQDKKAFNIQLNEERKKRKLE